MFNILLIDDDELVHTAMKVVSKAYPNYKIHDVYNTSDAVNELLNNKYDIILIDYLIGPPMHGDEFIQHIRKDSILSLKYGDTPIVLVTGSVGKAALKLDMIRLGVLTHDKRAGWHELFKTIESAVKFKADIGIVIALSEEAKPLLDILNYDVDYDEVLSEYYYILKLPETIHNNNIRCILRIINRMGGTNAALATERLIIRYNPKTIINMGLSGSLDKDVKIGDIIVAAQVEAYLHNSKAVDVADKNNYVLDTSGDPYKTDHVILSHAENFKYAHRRSYDDMQLQAGHQYDIIVKELENEFNSSSIETTPSAMLIHVNKFPEIHTGNVASDSVVDASEKFTEWLKDIDRKFIAIDMESAGVATAIYKRSCKLMVLRGISDLSDNRKSLFDNVKKGVFRQYALNNCILMLYKFIDNNLLF